MPLDGKKSRRSLILGLGGAASLIGCRDGLAGPRNWTDAEAALTDPFHDERVQLVAGDDQRPFGPRAPWNVPVRELRRDPGSDELVRRLWWEATPDRPGNVNLAFDEYTFPVYTSADATMEAEVRIERRSSPLDGERMPWNPDWQPAPGSDGQVIVLDPATGREWDLWRVSYDDGVVWAENGNLVPGSYWTREVGFAPSRGSGIPYLAMLVRPPEILAGEIRHALAMVVPNTDGWSFVAPATKIEHHRRVRDGIPQATRFALAVDDADIDAWLRQVGRRAPRRVLHFARIVARALRDYGWFVTDTGGSATLQFEARVSAGPVWSALGLKPPGREGVSFPRDLLDGLISPERIYALVPSDQYPEGLRARPDPSDA